MHASCRGGCLPVSSPLQLSVMQVLGTQYPVPSGRSRLQSLRPCFAFSFRYFAGHSPCLATCLTGSAVVAGVVGHLTVEVFQMPSMFSGGHASNRFASVFNAGVRRLAADHGLVAADDCSHACCLLVYGQYRLLLIVAAHRSLFAATNH